jgi:hypothetical protein
VLGSIVEHLGRQDSGADLRPIKRAEREAFTRSCSGSGARQPPKD